MKTELDKMEIITDFHKNSFKGTVVMKKCNWKGLDERESEHSKCK